jgi:hypothetical protein
LICEGKGEFFNSLFILDISSSVPSYPSMSRPLRILYPDAYYHVTCRGNGRAGIFLADSDRKISWSYLAAPSNFRSTSAAVNGY